MVDRLWHKTLLRCRRENTGINRTRDQTRALPRNNDQCYFVQGVKSPKILAEDGVRHAFRFLPQSGRRDVIIPAPF